MKARIRGIYSTALTKLLLDHGFQITQSTQVIRNRLNIEPDVDTPDIDIRDTSDKQGLVVEAKDAILNMFLNVITEELPNPLIYLSKVTTNAIYKGVVEQQTPHGTVINLGEYKGLLLGEKLEEGKELLVRVIDPGLGRDITLTTSITIPGRYAILIPENSIKISKKIRSPEARQTLFVLGKAIKPKNWGILWRTAAATRETKELIEEVKKLEEEAEKIFKKGEKESAPALLYEGERIAHIKIPYEAKRRLDEIRGKVTPTIPNHHFYKSLNSEFALVVDLAEKIISKNPELKEEVTEQVKETILQKYPKIGEIIEIEHAKLNGKRIHLTPGKIIEKTNNPLTLKLMRKFRSGGVYDALNIPIEEGDYGITEITQGSWYMKTSYYNKEKELKGEYYNISTGIEIHPQKVTYIDLAIDIVKWPNNDVKVVDKEELEEAYKKGIITEKYYKEILKNVEILEEKIKANIEG
nr:ribonuclease E/G [Candidatus Baldrarchaeota archaeon]